MGNKQYSQDEVERILVSYRDLLFAKQHCEEAFKKDGDQYFHWQRRFLISFRKYRETIPIEMQGFLECQLRDSGILRLEEICRMNREDIQTNRDF